jgi:hypothetical protein
LDICEFGGIVGGVVFASFCHMAYLFLACHTGFGVSNHDGYLFVICQVGQEIVAFFAIRPLATSNRRQSPVRDVSFTYQYLNHLSDSCVSYHDRRWTYMGAVAAQRGKQQALRSPLRRTWP